MFNQAFIKSAENLNAKYIDLGKFGVTLTRGWREALLKPAGVKEYSKNDSRLEDGIRMVAKSAYSKKQERSVQLSFILEGDTEADYLNKYESFLDAIAYRGQILFKVPVLNRIFNLVYTDCSKFGDFGLKCGNFTLTFTEPNPNNREVIENSTGGE